MEMINEFFSSPINVALLIFAGYLIYDLLKTEEPFVIPQHPKVIVKRNFTPKELSVFNGTNGQKIYIAINRNVYDVSSKPEFYGPGSMYENFSGRDASRGMAKNSFDENVLTPTDEPIDKLLDLNEEEKTSLKEWNEFFAGKYDCIGALVDEEELSNNK
jgi:membrane-associated progesterone receptor component